MTIGQALLVTLSTGQRRSFTSWNTRNLLGWQIIGLVRRLEREPSPSILTDIGYNFLEKESSNYRLTSLVVEHAKQKSNQDLQVKWQRLLNYIALCFKHVSVMASRALEDSFVCFVVCHSIYMQVFSYGGKRRKKEIVDLFDDLL